MSKSIVIIALLFFISSCGGGGGSSESSDTISINPIINSDSVWRNMSINLIAEYFLSKGENNKAQEYIQLLNTKEKK